MKKRKGIPISNDVQVHDLWKHDITGKQISAQNPRSTNKDSTDIEVDEILEKDYKKLTIKIINELREDQRNELRD